MSWALLLFGLGITIGNLVGGRLADWRLVGTVIAAFIRVALVLAAFTITSHAMVPALITLFVWGRPGLSAGLAAADLGGGGGGRSAQSGGDAEPVRLQLRQSHRCLARRRRAERGLAYAYLPSIGAGVAVGALAVTLVARGGAAALPSRDLDTGHLAPGA